MPKDIDALLAQTPREALLPDRPTHGGDPDPGGDGGLTALADPGLGLPLKPLTVGELPAFLRSAKPVLGYLAAGRIGDAILEEPEALIAATALAARVDRAWLEAQTPDVLVERIAAVVESNGDFFARRLTPALIRAAERMGALLAGAMSTPDSSGSG